MENDKPDRDLNEPVIEFRNSMQKHFLRWGEKEFGPWDELDKEVTFSPDRKHWAIKGTLHDRPYVVIDGVRYGPFDFRIEGPWFEPARDTFAFAAGRGDEFLLVAGGKVIRKGRIVRKPKGETIIHVGGKKFGPYDDAWYSRFAPGGRRWAAITGRDEEGAYLLLDGMEYGPFRELRDGQFSPDGSIFYCTERYEDKGQHVCNILINGEKIAGPSLSFPSPDFSPDGKRWACHVQSERFEGFIVDGREFPGYFFPFYRFDFSPDSRHWAAQTGQGKRHRLVLDGKEYGPYSIQAYGFLNDSHYFCQFRRRGASYIFLDGRVIGPYRCKMKKAIAIEDAFLNDLVFTRKGKKTVRSCVISLGSKNSSLHICFSPKTGETLREAIEIINAADTQEGVAAEHMYVRLKCLSENITYKLLEQRLIHKGKKSFDQLIIQQENGKQASYFFDITSFYGKFTEELKR